MNLAANLKAVAPGNLAGARAMAHRAAQLPTKAARANLPAEDDDSHSNLGFDRESGGFVSQPIAMVDGQRTVALGLAPLALCVLKDGSTEASISLGGMRVSEAETWLDKTLAANGLKPASTVTLPYELPDDVAAFDRFAEVDGAATLAAWFDLAAILLTRFADDQRSVSPGPSPVRCWPHHFDMATYVSLETGDPETARGIGVGMSPGDGSYDQPYFYINPWPHLDPEGLPPLEPPGHWHTEGFVGAIATGSDVLMLDAIEPGLARFVEAAFATGRNRLGV